MRCSLKGLALAAGLLWGGCLLFVGLLNLAVPDYGLNFLRMMSSVYPWFHASGSFGDVVIGAVDGFVDGAIAGILFGWLYNIFAGGGVAGLMESEMDKERLGQAPLQPRA